eukprot:s3001_g4.t1
MSSESSESWNKASESYAPFEAYTGQFTRAAAGALPGLLPDTSGTLQIMDVAAGTGASTFALCKTLSDHCKQKGSTAEVLATDFSDAMLKQLAEKLRTSSADPEVKAPQAAEEAGLLKVTSQVADAQDLSAFAEGAFDAITCSFGIMFPPSPDKVVREFWRLLKPGGVAIVTTWHYNNIPESILSDLAHVFKGHGRFEEVPLAVALRKFSSEAFMRRLFRGELGDGPLWKNRDLEARFFSGSSTCLPRHLAAGLNKNPLTSDFGHWDEEAAEKYMSDHWTEADGQVVLQGTALVLIAIKPKAPTP